jgi:hypothetical protein
MIYIAVRVERNEDGTFVPSKLRRNTSLHDALESAAPDAGAVVAVWTYRNVHISDHNARGWISMTNPDGIYTRTTWGEFMEAKDKFRYQMVED